MAIDLGNSVINQDVGRAAPKARILIYMKDKLAGDGSGERVLVELLGFKSVTTNLSMNGTGTATITIPNFKSAFIRFVSKKTLDATSEGQERYNEICKYYFDFILKDTSGLFTTLWGDSVVSRGDESANLDAFISDMKTWSRSRAELLSKGDIKKQMNADSGLIYALPFVDVFDHVFVDYLGQDGFWYAGFSGLITRIGDSYYRTGQQAITIQCKDYTCLLDNVSLVTAWNRFSRPETFSTMSDFVLSSEFNVKASVSPFANIFGNIKSVREVIYKVIDRAQDMWTLPGTNANYGVHFGVDVNGDKIKIFDTTLGTESVLKHDGMSARRGNSLVSFENPPENFRGFRVLSEEDYLSPKLIFIDPALYNMDNEFIHQVLASNLTLFKDSLQSGEQILNQLAAQMFAYKHQDANGNIIFELAKYNAMPNFNDYGGRGSATVLRHKAVDKTVTTTIETASDIKKTNQTISYCAPRKAVSFGIKSTGAGQYSFSDDYTSGDVADTGFSLEDISWYALKFHGVNYIMNPTDFIGFDMSRDESTLVTAVTSNALPPWMTPDDTIRQASEWYSGVATAPVELMAKVGVRRFNIFNLYNVHWGSGIKGSLILSYISAFILERQNAQWDSGSIQVSHRPELQVNRTFIIPLRWKSYLIMGVSNSWSAGGRHTTTLQVSYGHPIHQTLEFPWTAIEAEKAVFTDKKALADIISTVDADGKVVTK